jgi:hypothetical protein
VAHVERVGQLADVVEDRRRAQDRHIGSVEAARVEAGQQLDRVLDRVGGAVARGVEVGPVLAQGRISPDEAAALLGTRRIAALAARLTRADIRSIRGLHGVLPSVEAAYEAVLARLDELERQERIWR